MAIITFIIGFILGIIFTIGFIYLLFTKTNLVKKIVNKICSDFGIDKTFWKGDSTYDQ